MQTGRSGLSRHFQLEGLTLSNLKAHPTQTRFPCIPTHKVGLNLAALNWVGKELCAPLNNPNAYNCFLFTSWGCYNSLSTMPLPEYGPLTKPLTWLARVAFLPSCWLEFPFEWHGLYRDHSMTTCLGVQNAALAWLSRGAALQELAPHILMDTVIQICHSQLVSLPQSSWISHWNFACIFHKQEKDT